MKISTNISDNFLMYYDEARGIAIHKRKVLKNRNAKCLSYIQSKAIIFLTLLLLSLILILINGDLFICSLVFFLTAIIYFLIVFFRTISSYMFRKKQRFSNLIIIDEKGVTDESFYGITITIKWDKIKAIVVGKQTITVLTDTPVYFYFNIVNKEEIINYCLKYIDGSKIIY